MSLPIAVQVYSVRDDAASNPAGTMKAIKEMGYAGVEFAGLYGLSAKEMKDIVESNGLVPVSAHVGLNEMLDTPEKTFGDYKEIGCKWIAVPHIGPELRVESGNFDKTIESIRKAGTIAKQYGIQLLYHNHDFEFVKVDDEYSLDLMYRVIPSDLLMTELDTCWVKVAGEDPAEYVRKYSGKAPIVHLKDFIGSKSESMYGLIGTGVKGADSVEFGFKPIGHGVQDVPAIIKAAEEAGSQWLVVEQDRPSDGNSPLECIRMSREYLRSIGY